MQEKWLEDFLNPVVTVNFNEKTFKSFNHSYSSDKPDNVQTVDHRSQDRELTSQAYQLG